MARYKYDIKLTYNNNGKHTLIDSINIRKLFIDHDFKEKITPTMYCTLNIDKNLFDDIILNASTATMTLRIDKVVVTDEGVPKGTAEPMWDYECLYFIDNDINYNKEIDYKGDKNRKDIFKEVYIGLMFKNCIEYNKQTNNTTVIDSDMMNIVGKYIQDIPTLIEPFTYNPMYEQLIIPPHDSLYKTLEFLNNELSVFYDTSCRIFFEPDALYIMSSSGNPVARKTDIYDTVRFIVCDATDASANIYGISEDKENQSYVININALDTDYKIDHDTGKQFNSVTSILNPAKDNSVTELGSIKDTVSKITQSVSKLMEKVKSFASQNENILSEMSSAMNNIIKMNLDNQIYIPVCISAIDNAAAKIQAMPTPEEMEAKKAAAALTGGVVEEENTITKEEKERILKELEIYKALVTQNSSRYQGIVSDYKSGKMDASSIIGDITNSSGYVGGVTAINIKSNVPVLGNCMGQVKSDSKELSKYHQDTLYPYNNVTKNIVSSIQSVIASINSSGIEPEKIKEDMSNLNGCLGVYQGIQSNTSMYLQQFSKYATTFTNTATALTTAISNLGKAASSIDLKGIMSNTRINLSTLGETANSMLKKFADSAQSKMNALAASGLSFGKLDELTKNINSIGDITSLGKLGISSFDMDLNLGKDSGEETGTKIIPIKNDNANMLKNIKSDIENNKNIISLYKQDMDVSIFNINKKYIIRNYDAHSDQDGLFLLDRRVDIYVREDDRFLCNCLLTFSKVANSKEKAPSGRQLTEEEKQTLIEDVLGYKKFMGYI